MAGDGASEGSMRFECYEQLLAPRGAAVCEIDHPPPQGADIDCVGPIRGTIKLTNVGSGIRAVGKLSAAVRLSCSRCLEAMQQDLEVDIDEECALAQIDEPDAYEAGTDDVEAMPCPRMHGALPAVRKEPERGTVPL